jgi:hypothetical protein
VRLPALVLATSMAAVACGSSDSPGGPTPVATTISVVPSPVRIPQFGVQQVAVAILDQQGDTIPGLQPTFITDFGAPITVSQTGLVTSLGPARTTHFTVRSGGALLQVPVEVIPIPKSFDNLPPISKLGSGGYFPFQRPVVRDVLGDTIPDAPVTVTATPSILEVTTSGYLHSLGPLGAAFSRVQMKPARRWIRCPSPSPDTPPQREESPAGSPEASRSTASP